MSSYREEVTGGGLKRIRLRNSMLDLSILPEAGGKIFDLVDRRTGRNWFWHNPHFGPSVARRDADFYCEQDSGGWDEVLMSVRPAEVTPANGRTWQVPDHGDIIGRQWTVVDLSAEPSGDAICGMTVAGTDIPYVFTRGVRLLHEQAKVELSYFVSNHGEVPLPCYWCAHPLFSVEEGMRIEMAGTPPLRIDDAATREQCASGDEQRWPLLRLTNGTSRNLSSSFTGSGSGAGFASKLFMPSAECGAVQLTMPNNDERLAISFDHNDIPWLGLWINSRGWSGCGSEPYANIGIEPATSPYDSVDEAIRNNAIDWLQPDEVRTWSLLVELT